MSVHCASLAVSLSTSLQAFLSGAVLSASWCLALSFLLIVFCARFEHGVGIAASCLHLCWCASLCLPAYRKCLQAFGGGWGLLGAMALEDRPMGSTYRSLCADVKAPLAKPWAKPSFITCISHPLDVLRHSEALPAKNSLHCFHSFKGAHETCPSTGHVRTLATVGLAARGNTLLCIYGLLLLCSCTNPGVNRRITQVKRTSILHNETCSPESRHVPAPELMLLSH